MKIVVQRGVTLSFQDLPSKSLALDGYIQGPAIDVENQRYSFDHHAGCLRLVTKATCAQVLDALILGLNPRDMTVYLNDVDGDTVLSVWLLQHPELVKAPLVRDLVEDVANVDAHGPSYFPFVRDQELCQRFFKGVMEPEARARRDGSYATVDLEDLLEQCLHRIDQLIFENDHFNLSQDLNKSASYEITHQGQNWVMVQSNEPVFAALYRDGYRRVVAYHPVEVQLPSGEVEYSWAYTIAKQSDLVSGFPIPEILHCLAQIEPGWGGGSSIGGAPRRPNGSRSYLCPDNVFAIIDAALNGRALSAEEIALEEEKMEYSPHNLKKARLARGFTRKALAERAGVSASAIVKIEAGARSPTIEVLTRLARALGVKFIVG